MVGNLIPTHMLKAALTKVHTKMLLYTDSDSLLVLKSDKLPACSSITTFSTFSFVFLDTHFIVGIPFLVAMGFTFIIDGSAAITGSAAGRV